MGTFVDQLWGILDRKSNILSTKMADIWKVPLCSSVQGCHLYRASLEVHRCYLPEFPALRRSPKFALLSTTFRSLELTAFLAKWAILHIVQCPLGLAPLGLATILGLATRNSGFLDDQYINSTLGLATYIGFSDLNRVDKNWSLNPAGTVFENDAIFRIKCAMCANSCQYTHYDL